MSRSTGQGSTPSSTHLLLEEESIIDLLICVLSDLESSKMASSRERSGGGGDGKLVPFGVDESRRVGWGCLWVG